MESDATLAAYKRKLLEDMGLNTTVRLFHDFSHHPFTRALNVARILSLTKEPTEPMKRYWSNLDANVDHM